MRRKKKVQIIISRDHKNLFCKNRKLTLLEYFPLSVGKSQWIFFINYNKGVINSIESVAFRRYMRKKTKRKKTQFLVRFFPNIKLTKKSLGVRMGGGKGSKVYLTVKPVSRGFILAAIRRPAFFRARKLLSRFRRKFSLFLRRRGLRVASTHNKVTLSQMTYFKSNKIEKTGKFDFSSFFLT